METTTIKIINEYGEYTIKVNRSDLDVNEMIDLFVDVMTAVSYSREVVIKELQNVSE